MVERYIIIFLSGLFKYPFWEIFSFKEGFELFDSNFLVFFQSSQQVYFWNIETLK